MVKFIKLEFSYWFSYGPDNVIRFDEAPITQIVGKNGHGKSSIGLVLEEVLYNKNSKGIKKSNIINRYADVDKYTASLYFNIDNIEYRIDTSRGTTQKVSLFRDGIDISSHTATATFKDIEALIGYDHKTFCQIIYQSSAQSLEFLSATDSARKKFLIDLLQLERYTSALEVIKSEALLLKNSISVSEGKMAVIDGWLAKYKDTDLTMMELLEPITIDPKLGEDLTQLKVTRAGLTQENKRRAQNNTYKELRDKITLVEVPVDTSGVSSLADKEEKLAVALTEQRHLESRRVKLANTNTSTRCPTCGQSLGADAEKAKEHIANEVASIKAELAEYPAEIAELKKQIAAKKAHNDLLDVAKYAQAEYEKYHSLYDPSMPSEIESHAELDEREKVLNAAIAKHTRLAAEIDDKNAIASRHNSRVETLLEQKVQNQADAAIVRAELNKQLKRATTLALLVKSFSSTGLIAYKIEGLTKELEATTNEYLNEISDGRFQLSFQITGGDKLSVVITDNGYDVEILALSNGERARVNVATLLAIRKLMQDLSSTKSNLLILDETVENLDVEGKERLVEILLNETTNNTFLISHGFTHPLLEKIMVVKEDNFSSIVEA